MHNSQDDEKRGLRVKKIALSVWRLRASECRNVLETESSIFQVFILYSTGNIRHFSPMKNEVDSYGYFVHILYPESKKKKLLDEKMTKFRICSNLFCKSQ